jgi:hypothetical protein
MTISITSEQVRGLAPDEASMKAARSLATPRPWSKLGQDGRVIWGACQGSGKDPYLTQIDWEGPAFKCSCPSRKFPCKHGLALLLLLAEQPQHFTSGDASSTAPDWVTSWIASRDKRLETKAAKEPAPVDEAARAERAEQRTGRVSEGLELLDLWLKDLVQQGLSSAPSRGFSFWDQQAARLVDAQAPGVARRVRDLAGLALSGEGWQDRMLSAIARLVLIIQGFSRIDKLPPDAQADLRTAIGLPISHADVLATEPVRDRWLVSGQRIYQEDRMRVQRTWLLGDKTGRAAMLLDFAVGTAGFKTNLLPGTIIQADVCFFPSASPLRALLKEVMGNPQHPKCLIQTTSIAEAFQSIGSRLAANPWTEIHPVALRAVVPLPQNRHCTVADEFGSAMRCHLDLSLVAFSAGRPIDIFGEWDGHVLHVLLAQAPERFTAFRPVSAA